MTIKIHKNLGKYVDFDPTKESNPRALRDLCSEIEKGNIVLPIFQTYIRWQIEKSMDLLNFQLRGKAAVAPISINKIKQRGDVGTQITFIDRKILSDEEIFQKESVIDGQQRLTCNYKAYSNHPDFKNIVFDISLGKFLLNVEALKDSQVPVGILYNKDPEELDRFISERKYLQPYKISGLLGKIRNKFLGYYYTVNIANDLSESEQLEWFEVLNLAGTKVTGVQVQLTEMLVKGVDYYREYSQKFLEILKEADFDELLVQKSTELSIPLAMLNPAIEFLQKRSHKGNFCPIPSDVKASLVSKMKADEIRKLFSIALIGLEKAINFINTRKLKRPVRIDYITYLSGAFMYIGDKNFDENHLINWFDNVNFSDKSNTDRREIFDRLIKPYSI
ncbi:hypothetical protein [Brevibacillus laterosporus]|uniref:hypothetical protein n=1 Tax=Brevibacillus laterosporus TaxID=1465 RepID=UPI000EB512C9|nr:hypothetical protein [Brevibacillus laterosporus]AYK05657.1 hypothetical protein D8Z77_04145 [Brevibacillus laterosporus]